MPFRSFAQPIALVVAVLTCGCATDGSNPVADAFHQTVKSVTTPVNDTPGDRRSGDEQWNDEMGPEARKQMPVEHENDPLKDVLISPRAQDIERSLGVEYD